MLEMPRDGSVSDMWRHRIGLRLKPRLESFVPDKTLNKGPPHRKNTASECHSSASRFGWLTGSPGIQILWPWKGM
jgi:hypothetical protein